MDDDVRFKFRAIPNGRLPGHRFLTSRSTIEQETQETSSVNERGSQRAKSRANDNTVTRGEIMNSPVISSGRRRRRDASPPATPAAARSPFPRTRTSSPSEETRQSSSPQQQSKQRQQRTVPAGQHYTMRKCSLFLVFVLILWGLMIHTVMHRSREQIQTVETVQTDSSLSSAPPQHPRQRQIGSSQVNTTLALVDPPGLLGGYRNQVIRLISLCAYAATNNLTQLLLPSVMWSTQVDMPIGKHRIPMEWVFDVNHWNSFADHLPVLVDSTILIEQGSSDCWSSTIHAGTTDDDSLVPLQRAVRRAGGFEPLAKYLRNESLYSRSSDDLYPLVEHCRHPVAYGGGKKAGRLWSDHGRYRKDKATKGAIPMQQDKWIMLALRPAAQWRALAEQCVRNNAAPSSTGTETKFSAPTPYLALHARVELDMLAHRCGRTMERNLTKIVERVEHLTATLGTPLEGVFVAISRNGMETNDGPLYRNLKPTVDENLQTLNRLVGYNGTTRQNMGADKTLQVFQCGQRLVDDYYAAHLDVPDHGSLVSAVIDFYVAVNSAVFVGVRGSTFSSDVWTTRYHQGNGETNYEYTKEGIDPIENGGLPIPHVNCKGRK